MYAVSGSMSAATETVVYSNVKPVRSNEPLPAATIFDPCCVSVTTYGVALAAAGAISTHAAKTANDRETKLCLFTRLSSAQMIERECR
jgi:hypothetical protein